MIIQIENKDYQLIETDHDSIQIYFVSPELYKIYAPSSLSIDELTTYVKQFAKSNVLIPKSKVETFEFFTIRLFDMTYPVKPLNKGNYTPYMKQNIIYYSKVAVKIKNKKKLEESIRDTIYEQSILDLVSKWEEKLNFLVDEVSFKKLRSRFYNISGAKLIVNRKNLKFSYRINEYLIANALITLSGFADRQKDILEKHFSDINKIEKIMSYGI